MNDKGKLNITIIIVGIFVISIFSASFLALSSKASNGAMPDMPSMLQESQDGNTDDSAPIEDDESVYQEETPAQEDEESVDEEQPLTVEIEEDEDVILEETEEESELILVHVGGGQYDVIPPTQKKGLSHSEQTPHQLSSLAITYKEPQDSNVGQRTQNLLNVNLPEAMFRKNMVAREYQTPDNVEARIDPLYVTDHIPDALRPELEGEGITGSVDQSLIDQLIESQISTIFTYMPIHIIGTMQNGPYKSALLSIPMVGYYGIMREGQGHQFAAYGTDQGVYVVNFYLQTVSEDSVSIVLSATLVDRVYGRTLATTAPVTRHFYIRRYH